jgi:hypothetical protein
MEPLDEKELNQLLQRWEAPERRRLCGENWGGEVPLSGGDGSLQDRFAYRFLWGSRRLWFSLSGCSPAGRRLSL